MKLSSRLSIALSALATAAALAVLPASAQFRQCPTERGIWEMTDQNEDVFRITMHRSDGPVTAVSDLYMHLQTPDRSYWFVFAASASDAGASLTLVQPPRNRAGVLSARPVPVPARGEAAGLMAFYALSGDVDYIEGAPASGIPAPQYIFVPELGQSLQDYSPAPSSRAERGRSPLPRGVFHLKGCARA